MGKFAKLDYITVKPYITLKNAFIYTVMGLMFGSLVGPISGASMVLMMACMYNSYPFIVGEQNNLETFYATLPGTKRDMVRGRYLFNAGAILIGLLLSSIIYIVSILLSSGGFAEHGAIEAVSSMGTMAVIFFLLSLVQLPIYYKMGYAKAKFVVYLPIVLLSFGSLLTIEFFGSDAVYSVLNSIARTVEAQPVLAGAVFIAVLAAAVVVSYKISCKVYEEKSF